MSSSLEYTSRENLRQNIGRASCNFQFKGITMELLSNHYINKERSPFFQLGQHTFSLSSLHPFLWVKGYIQPCVTISTLNYISNHESYFIPESGFQPWIRITIKLLSNYYVIKEKSFFLTPATLGQRIFNPKSVKCQLLIPKGVEYNLNKEI